MASKISTLSLVLLLTFIIVAAADTDDCRVVGSCESKDQCRKLCKKNNFDPHAALCIPSRNPDIADCCCIIYRSN
ncbi:hypothetical protein AMTRI_Chr09g43200 [Amborella trichopoda]